MSNSCLKLDNLESKRNIKWTRPSIINEAEALLEKHQPKAFNINFFRRHRESLYKAIAREFIIGENKCPYSNFVLALKPEWQELYIYKPKRWTRNLIIQKAEALLEKHQPKAFNMIFFRKYGSQRMLQSIKKEFITEGEEYKYQNFILALKPEWQKRFAKDGTKRNQYSIIQEAEALLEKHQPKVFGMKFFREHYDALHRAVLKEFVSGDEEYRYQNFILALKPEWQKRSRYVIDDTVRLKHLLKSSNPATFNPQLINSRDSKLYARLHYRIIKTKEHTWESIFSKLGNDANGNPWISRWNRRRFYKDFLPKTAYWDEVPVEQIVELHREHLYVFVQLLNEDDKFHFEEICIKMIKLAQAGNTSASDFLEDNLSYTVQNLIDNSRYSYQQILLSRLVHHPELVTREIARSIFRFDCNYGSKFFNYLYTTMVNLAKQVDPMKFHPDGEYILNNHTSELSDTQKYFTAGGYR